MRFSMSHHFDCTPQELWDIFESREFDDRLEEETGVRREVLDERSVDGIIHKKLKCISLKELPAVMKKALGTDHLEFEQTNELDREASVLKWDVVTPFLTDRVDAGGKTRVEPSGEGCTRTIEGEITIRLPLVGKKMEKKLSENLRDSYEKAATIAREMLKAREE